MLFTSGSWTPQYRDAWRLAARQLRQRGVEIYAVGIGPSVDRGQLNDITENVYVESDLPSVTPAIDYDIRTGIYVYSDSSNYLRNVVCVYNK